MQTFLSFRDAPTGSHERRIEEIRMSIMQLRAIQESD